MNTKLNKIKLALQKLIAESFAQVSTTKGIIAWDSDTELPAVDDVVYALDEEGNQIVAEDGEYGLDDGTVIVVSEAKVTEIREPEKGEEEPVEEPSTPEAEETTEEPVEEPQNEEEEPKNEETEEPAAEETVEEQIDERDARIAELEGAVAERDARIAELEARIKELEEKPAAESATEEFKSVNKIESTGNRKLDNLARIMNA